MTACAWVYNTQTSDQWSLTPAGIDEEQVIHQLGARVVLQHIINSSESNIGTWTGGVQYKSTVADCFTTNAWHHIAVVTDPIEKIHLFYIDGVQIGDIVLITGTIASNTGGFRIGAHRNLASFWHGKLDDVCLFEGNLTPEQLTRVMNNDFTGFTALNSTKADLDINIYPIPAINVVNINKVVKAITLLGLDGHKISEKQNVSSMDISTIPVGNYLLKIEGNEGVTFKKLAVMH